MQYQFIIHDKTPISNGFFKTDRYTVSYEKFSGGMIESVWRECGKKGDIVAIIPYDPILQEIILVEQFRIGMVVRGEHPWTFEIVAGFMDVEGEDKITTAKRELLEETGCHTKKLHPLLNYYPSPGGSGSKVHIFIAEVDATEALKHTGIEAEGEDIHVHRIPLKEMHRRALSNEIDNATAIIAFQQFFFYDWPNKLNASQSEHEL